MTTKELRETIKKYREYLLSLQIENLNFESDKRKCEVDIETYDYQINKEENYNNQMLTYNCDNKKVSKKEYYQVLSEMKNNCYSSLKELIESSRYNKYFLNKCLKEESIINDELSKLNEAKEEFESIKNLVDKYNQGITANKQKNQTSPSFFLTGIILLMVGFFMASFMIMPIISDTSIEGEHNLYFFILPCIYMGFVGLKLCVSYRPKKVNNFIIKTINKFNESQNVIHQIIAQQYIKPYLDDLKLLKEKRLNELVELQEKHERNIEEINLKYNNVMLPLGIRSLYYRLDEDMRDLFLTLGLNAESEKDFNDIYTRCLNEKRENTRLSEYKKQTIELSLQTEELQRQTENKLREEQKRTEMMENYNREQLSLLEKNNELQKQANEAQAKYNRERIEESKKQTKSLKRQEELAEYYHNKNDF